MTPEDRRSVAFHEAGHAAMVYWRRESLHARRIVLHKDRFGGSLILPGHDYTEDDLMVLIGGPMAEFLSMGIVPKIPLRFANEYRNPNSDSSRMRELVRALRAGKDDRRYQFDIQERCRAIIQHPRIWQGISAIAERLDADGEISGEECERILQQAGAPDQFMEGT
jgi:hypothetical protein